MTETAGKSISMKVTKTQVTKLLITDAPMPDGLGVMDPIAVIVENFGPGEGKITVTCFNDAWSAYWSHMGEQHTLESFFIKASNAYLIGKLKIGISYEIDDEDSDALEKLLKKKIIKMRRNGDLTNEQAREFWSEASYVDWSSRHDICAEILGEEWWYRTPKKPNPDYEHLGRVVDVIKEAFKQQMERT